MPDLRFLIDFHWATSCLVGGWSSCRDDRSSNAARDDGRCSRAVLLAVGDNAAIGSSWMQKPSSASSESTAAASSLPSADTGDLRPPNVRSSDKTNRLEFLRCWIMAASRGCTGGPRCLQRRARRNTDGDAPVVPHYTDRPQTVRGGCVRETNRFNSLCRKLAAASSSPGRRYVVAWRRRGRFS